MVTQEEVDTAHQLRAWSDAGTLLDFYSITEDQGLQVRIRILDVREEAGAQYIAYELELVEASTTPAAPRPSVVGAGGGLAVNQGVQADARASVALKRVDVVETLGLPVATATLGAATGHFLDPLSLAPFVRSAGGTPTPDTAIVDALNEQAVTLATSSVSHSIT